MKIVIIGTVASSILGFRGPMIRLLVERGHSVYAFAIDFNDEHKTKLRSWGVVPVDYSLSRSGLNVFADLLTIFRLRKLIKTIQPCTVFSYFVKPVIYGSIAAHLAGVPKRIAMLEGLGFVFTDPVAGPNLKLLVLRKIQTLLYRISFPSIHKLIFLNPDDIHDLIERNNLKPKSVHMLGGIGLNLREFQYSKPSVSVINFLFIGRLIAEKGIYIFVEAAKIVKEKFPCTKFTVLGGLDEFSPGGMKQFELDSLIVNGTINFPGQVSNVADYIAECSVFVLPSYYREGVPRSSQEAMAVGRPILTTDTPGCRETVIDGVNGFLVPPYDAISLAEKIIWFIENQNEIENMGLESRKIAEEKFDANKVNSKLLHIVGA